MRRRKRRMGKGLRRCTTEGSEGANQSEEKPTLCEQRKALIGKRAKAPFGSRVCFCLEDRSKFGRKEPSMMLIGCDYHPSWQQICWLDTTTGETAEKETRNGKRQRS
jgi:hypothetical protein